MVENTTKYYINSSDELPEEFFGKVFVCIRLDGRKFASRLIGSDGDVLIFENSVGRKFYNRLSSLAYLAEVV